MTCNNHISLPGIAKNIEHKIKVAASTRKGLGPFSECIEYGGNDRSNVHHYTLTCYSSISYKH